MRSAGVFSLVALLSAASSSQGDVLILKSGQVINGTVLQRDGKGVLIKLDYGTFTYPVSMLKDVKVEDITATAARPDHAGSPDRRIPAWGSVVTLLAKKTWATEFKQIPATVIDKGILQNVPYLSFRCA